MPSNDYSGETPSDDDILLASDNDDENTTLVADDSVRQTSGVTPSYLYSKYNSERRAPAKAKPIRRSSDELANNCRIVKNFPFVVLFCPCVENGNQIEHESFCSSRTMMEHARCKRKRT